jgi:acetate---CoA ligase (ADP-forming)
LPSTFSIAASISANAMPTPPNNTARNLAQVLLAPHSVAIVGQSNDPAKTAGRPLKYLRQAGFSGRIYPVNARRDEVLGERAWRSVGELPEVPEHVYIVAPTDAVIEVVEECAKLRVAVATILADGFAGPAGAARTARLKDIAQRSGIRVVGPSSLGVLDLRSRLFLTANAAFAETDLPVGRTFAVSHSGSLIGALASRGKARGVGFAGLVSVGNEADLSIGEICKATLDDPGIDGYLLFLETMRKADALRAFALAAAERGKPIVAYKLGRSDEARELAVTHTGALAGEDAVADAFLADCGIARVDTLEALIESLLLVARVPLASAGKHSSVGVVTTTVGGAAMVLDRLAMTGVRVAEPSAATLAHLGAAGIEVAPARLIDLTIAGAQYDTMKKALDILTAAPEFDLLVAVVGSSARFHPELAVRPIVDSAGTAKPIVAFLVPDAPQALAQLGAAGVPGFRTPEACADAIAATLSRRPPRPLSQMRTGPLGDGRLLDELEAGAVLDRLGIARAPSVALSANLTTAPALPFAYPVAVKVLSADISHKSDVGGVVLDIRNAKELIDAIRGIRELVGGRADRVVVQPMVSGVGEVLLGYRIDRDVGPLIMVAAGGLYTEIYRDRALRLAPVDLAQAREMIGDVQGLAILRGYRGRPAGNLEALAQAIVALSRLAVIDDLAVVEAEINPLMVRPDGVMAVDALVKLV